MRFHVNGRTIEQNNSLIGVQGDNQVEVIQFVVPRFYSEIDLNYGIPYIVYRLPDNTEDQIELEKLPEEESMVLTWIVGSQITKTKGLMKAGLKISGLNGVLWGSNLTGFIIAESIAFESPQQPVFRMAAFSMPQVQSFEAPVPELRVAQPDTEPPITVVERKINIPAVLQTIAVQNDANSETVSIQMPRYFDENDLYEYEIFLKTILPEAGGRDDILLHPELRDDTTLIMPWTLKPPQTSYSGALGLQIYVTGVKPDGSAFKWETYDTSVIIAASQDADPFIPSAPAVFDEFIKRIMEIEREAKTQAESAKTSQQSALDSQKAAELSAQSATLSAENAAASELASSESAASAEQDAKDASAAAEIASQAKEHVARNAEIASAAAADAESVKSAVMEATTAAVNAGNAAVTAAQNAELAKTIAEDAKASAENAKASAENEKNAAIEASVESVGAAQKAELAQTGAESSADTAASFAASAEASKTAAEQAEKLAQKHAALTSQNAESAASAALRAEDAAARAEAIAGGDFATKQELSTSVDEAKGYADTKAGEAMRSAKSYTDTTQAALDKKATEYTDNEIIAVKEYTDTAIQALQTVMEQSLAKIVKDALEAVDFVMQFKSYLEFPSLGDPKTLYMDTTMNKTYRWEEGEKRYFVVGSDYEQIKVIDGGKANG